MPKVSIIVPVYNAEKFIERCATSILTQEFEDFELILANDGSTDATSSILARLAADDPRVVILDKPNSGVSDTRNKALDMAQGEWVQFLDADDWITPDATKLLVRSAEENDCDMVVADFYRVVGERVSRKSSTDAEGVMTREEYGDEMMERPADFYYGVVWNKLYRRSIIEEFGLRMDVTLDWCEDFIFNMEYVLHCEKIYPLHVPIYYYVKTPGSLVAQGSTMGGTVRMKLNVIEYYRNFYKQVYDEEEYRARRPEIYRFLVSGATDGEIMPWQRASQLGDERTSVRSNPYLVEGPLAEHYLSGKLLDHCLERVSVRFGLDLRDVRIIAYATEVGEFSSRAELADYAGVSTLTLRRSLQKPSMRKLLSLEPVAERGGIMQALSSATALASDNVRAADKVRAAEGIIGNTSTEDDEDESATTERSSEKDERVRTVLTPEGATVVQEIATALADYEHIRFGGLDEDDVERVKAAERAMADNIRRVLE